MKKIKLMVLISIASVGVIVAGSIPLAARINYQNYLNGIKEGSGTTTNSGTKTSGEEGDKELVLEGITAKLKDGKGYYDNGKAIPQFDDFEVYAQYKQGDEAVEERLYGDQVTREVPDDFVKNGGTIKFSYKGKTFDFSVALAKVALSSIKILENPFLIYYKEGEKLDITGIKIEGVNNDGSSCSVDASTITASTEALKAGTTEGVVFLKNNPNVKGSFPITVVEEKDYNEGEVLSYSAIDGSFTVEDGEKLSDADLSSLEVTAQYSCGNKRRIGNDKITIEDADKTITFGSDTTVKVKIQNGTSSETILTKIKTEKALNADCSPSREGFEKKNTDVYEIGADGSFPGTATNEAVLSSKDGETRKLTFTFKSATFTTADASIDLALSCEKENDAYVSNASILNQVVSFKVNGASKNLSNDVATKKVENSDENKANNAFQKLSLRNINVVEGENTIELTLRGDYKGNISLREIHLTSLGEEPKYSFPSYLENHELAKKDKMADATFYSIKNSSFYKDSTGELKIPYSSFIDNGFLYSFIGAYEGKKAALVKFDFSTMNEVRSNLIIPEHDAIWDNLGSIVDLGDDKLGLVKANTSGSAAHELTVYSKDTLEEVGKITLKFSWDVSVKGLAYNKTLKKFAVYTGDRTWLLDGDGNRLSADFIGNFESWGTLEDSERVNDLAGNDDYIIVTTQQNDTYNFRTLVFDWEGNEVYHTPADQKYCFDYEKMPGAYWDYWKFGTSWESRAYQLIRDGDDVYLMCSKIANDGFFISTPMFSSNFAKHFDSTTLGGYIGKAANKEKEPKFTSKLLNTEGKKITISYNGEDKESIIDSAVTLDGKVYATIAVNGGSQAAILAQLNVTDTGVTIEKQSDVFNLTANQDDAEWIKATTIFAKDGKLGVFNKRTSTITFYDPATLEKTSDAELTVTGTDDKAIYGTYSDVHKEYVFFDNNKFYFADGNGNLTGKSFPNQQPEKEEGNTENVLNRQLTTDGSYIYMLYTQDGSYNAKVGIYSWEGDYVGLATIPLTGTVDGTGEFKKFNVKNIFFLNDKIYLDVFAHDGKGNFTYEATIDQSIFTNP